MGEAAGGTFWIFFLSSVGDHSLFTQVPAGCTATKMRVAPLERDFRTRNHYICIPVSRQILNLKDDSPRCGHSWIFKKHIFKTKALPHLHIKSQASYSGPWSFARNYGHRNFWSRCKDGSQGGSDRGTPGKVMQAERQEIGCSLGRGTTKTWPIESTPLRLEHFRVKELTSFPLVWKYCELLRKKSSCESCTGRSLDQGCR